MKRSTPRCPENLRLWEAIAEINGHRDQALNQPIAVNGWSWQRAEYHVREAFSEWHYRSAIDCGLDLGILIDVDIDITTPPDANTCKTTAAQTLNSRNSPAATTTPPPTSIPQGWYPDPAKMFTHRWWDGLQWTRHVALKANLCDR